MSDTITLDFLGRQLTTRVEASVTALTTEVRAMHSRHARLERRVEALEGGR